MKPIARFFVSSSFKILKPCYDINRKTRDKIKPIMYITIKTIVKIFIVIKVELLLQPLYDTKNKNLLIKIAVITNGDDITISNNVFV